MSWLPVAAAGIQAGGSLLGGVLGASGASATNAQSIQAAQSNLAQQENYNTDMFNRQVELSNTAYQRAMADMKAAGLNPILAATTGGASTPPALGVNPPMPSLQNPGALMQSGMTSAAQAGQVYQQVKSLQATANKDDAQADVNKATEDLTKKQSEKTVQDTAVGKATERLTDAAALTKVSEAAANYANASNSSALARVNTRVAEDTERFGDSTISKAVGGLLRMLNTGINQMPNAAKAIGVTPPSSTPPAQYRRGPDGRPITDFWGRPK